MSVPSWVLRVAVALVLCACRPEPARPVVEEIQLEGLRRVGEKPIRDGLATTETARLFGLFEGVLEYSTYDPNVLARDLQRIERYLRARGYYEAKVTTARVVRLGNNRVRVEVEVHEGEPVRVGRIEPGVSRLPFDAMLAANEARNMADGDIFDEERFEADQRSIESVLRDQGFAFAKVEAVASVDIAHRTATVTYAIEAGPRARYGPVTIAGLVEIPEGPVRENLQIRAGEPYSESDLEDARRALVNLGVFSNVELVPDRSKPESARVPITVRVQEGALRTVRLGGGVRFDVLRLASRLETGWEHKNFLGGLRRFNLDARPGVTFFPTRIDRLEFWTTYLPESRITAALRQPAFLEGRTTGVLRTEYNVFPVLYPLPEGVDPEAERIIGYHEVRASAGVERTFFGHHLRLAPSYNWQANFPFTYQQARPKGLDRVIVYFPELVTELDFRDDPIRTRRGFYFANSLQVAGQLWKDSVSDVRVTPEARLFLPIDRSVLALRLSFGFLFPNNYGQTLTRSAGVTDDTDGGDIRDQQILNLRAFYSGGPNSNRGYPFRGVGPHGPIGFLVPTNVDCTRDPTQAGCIRPLGGVSLWEASVEARIPFPIDAPFEAVVFVDASDLTRTVGQIRTDVPHLSPGFGLRYLTPIGPVRFDVGWRVPSAQALGEDELPESEGRPGGDLFGLFPGAAHLIIGSEAF